MAASLDWASQTMEVLLGLLRHLKDNLALARKSPRFLNLSPPDGSLELVLYCSSLLWIGLAMIGYVMGTKLQLINVEFAEGDPFRYIYLPSLRSMSCPPALVTDGAKYMFCSYYYEPWQKIVDSHEVEVVVLTALQWLVSKGRISVFMSFLITVAEMGIFRFFQSQMLLSLVWLVMLAGGSFVIVLALLMLLRSCMELWNTRFQIVDLLAFLFNVSFIQLMLIAADLIIDYAWGISFGFADIPLSLVNYFLNSQLTWEKMLPLYLLQQPVCSVPASYLATMNSATETEMSLSFGGLACDFFIAPWQVMVEAHALELVFLVLMHCFMVNDVDLSMGGIIAVVDTILFVFFESTFLLVLIWLLMVPASIFAVYHGISIFVQRFLPNITMDINRYCSL